MAIQIEALPNDIAELKRLVLAHAKRAEEKSRYADELAPVVETLTEKLSEEKEKYEALQRLVFGSKSEKKAPYINPKQELLFNEAETFTDAPQKKTPTVTVAAHERKKTGRKPFPANLERNEILHVLSDEERACPACGSLRPEIGEERTEELRLIPAKAVVDVHVMKKYGPCPCKACQGTETTPILQAPGPAKIVPGSRFSNGTIAFFLTSKFVDAQPFYRMEDILARWGVDTGRSTLCSLAISTGRALGDLVTAIREDIKTSPVIGMDETTVQVLHETNRSAQSKSYMWIATGFKNKKRLIFFHYHPTRAGNVATEFLKGYSGYLQTDGYSGYARVGNSPGIVHVGCMAHIRRQFYDADQAANGKGDAADMLAMIREFYHEEELLRARYEHNELNEAAFVGKRKKLQEPRLQHMYEWLIARNMRVAPRSGLGKAISYALGQWQYMIHYLDHSLLTPDNNGLENAIRPFVVGRKNWLFSNTPSGAHTSAGLYSLIETGKANNHEPYKYLCYIFDMLPKAKTLEEKLALLPYRLDPASY
jgi:transposase